MREDLGTGLIRISGVGVPLLRAPYGLKGRAQKIQICGAVRDGVTEDCTIYQELYTACAIQAVFMQDNSSQSDPEGEVLCYKNRAAVTPQAVACCSSLMTLVVLHGVGERVE